MNATERIRRQAATPPSRALIIAQIMALGALLLNLLFLFRTTGGTVFLFTTLAPVLAFGSVCLLLLVVITGFRRRNKTQREMLAQMEVLMSLTSPVTSGLGLAERLDTLALLARASLGANAVAVVLFRGDALVVASGEAQIMGQNAAHFALRVKDTEELAVYDQPLAAALLGLESPPASSVVASSLRHGGEVAVMLAEFRPELLTRGDSDLLLDLVRIFAEKVTTIAIENAALLETNARAAESGTG